MFWMPELARKNTLENGVIQVDHYCESEFYQRLTLDFSNNLNPEKNDQIYVR